MTVKTKSNDIVEQDTRKTLTWDTIITHFNFWLFKARRGPRVEAPGADGHRRAGDPPPPLRRAGHGASGPPGRLRKGPRSVPALRTASGPRTAAAAESRARDRGRTSAPPGTGSVGIARSALPWCSVRLQAPAGRREISRGFLAERRGLGGSGVAPGLVWPGNVVFSFGLLRSGGPWSSWSESSTG